MNQNNQIILDKDDLQKAFVFLVSGILVGIFLFYFLTVLCTSVTEIEQENPVGDEKKPDQQEQKSDPKDFQSAKSKFDIFMRQLYPIDKVKKGDILMALVVRTDLKMEKGKIAAQCSHATLGSYKQTHQLALTLPYWREVIKEWKKNGQEKIVFKIGSEEELQQLELQASEEGVPKRLIRDAGRTQIAAGSKTVLGLGPATKRQLEELTKNLKLL